MGVLSGGRVVIVLIVLFDFLVVETIKFSVFVRYPLIIHHNNFRVIYVGVYAVVLYVEKTSLSSVGNRARPMIN